MATTSESSTGEKMGSALADKILPMFDGVCQERDKYYTTHPVPERGAVPSIISAYSYKCGAVAVACNLVPGPLGLLTIVPEIALIFREQLNMIYDIGRAYGHHDISKELLLVPRPESPFLPSSTGSA